MNFTARDALRFVWPFIGQYGAIYSFGTDNFLYLLNTCIEAIYGENGFLRSREHTKEAYTNLTPDADGVITLVTTYPVVAVDKFRVGKMLPMNGVASNCDCPEPTPDPCTYTATNMCCSSYCACSNGEGMEYTKVLPQNKLQPGEYQVSGGDLPGMGGLSGRVIRVMPDRSLTGLRVTYYRGPNFITSFDDKVALPQSRVATVLPFLMASFINIDRSAFFEAKYTKKISDLKNEDNIFPKKMAFDPNYPFFGDSNPALIPQ